MIDPKAPDHSYFEWPYKDEFRFSVEEWQKANPSINELRARAGLPPYDGSLGDHKHNLKETTND